MRSPRFKGCHAFVTHRSNPSPQLAGQSCRGRRSAGPQGDKTMTATVKRLTLGLGAGLFAADGRRRRLRPCSGSGYASGPPVQRAGPGGPDGPGGFRGPGGPMGLLPRLGREISLTDAQRDQIKAIAESHKADWNALADRARTARIALNDAVNADTDRRGAHPAEELRGRGGGCRHRRGARACPRGGVSDPDRGAEARR